MEQQTFSIQPGNAGIDGYTDYRAALTRDHVRVELECIGEGFDGEFDPSDPDDRPLYRFSVFMRQDDHELDGKDLAEIFRVSIKMTPSSAIPSPIPLRGRFDR